MTKNIESKNTQTIELLILAVTLIFSFFLPFNNFILYGTLVTLFVVFSVIARYQGISMPELGFKNISNKTASVWIITTISLLLLIFLVKYFYPDGLFVGILKNRSDFIYIIPAYIFFGSFFQEFVFRGYFFARIRSFVNENFAIIINVIIFSLFHLPYIFHFHSYLFFLSIIGGIFWSISYAKYPNIYMAWFSHAIVGSATLLLLQRF